MLKVVSDALMEYLQKHLPRMRFNLEENESFEGYYIRAETEYTHLGDIVIYPEDVRYWCYARQGLDGTPLGSDRFADDCEFAISDPELFEKVLNAIRETLRAMGYNPEAFTS